MELAPQNHQDNMKLHYNLERIKLLFLSLLFPEAVWLPELGACKMGTACLSVLGMNTALDWTLLTLGMIWLCFPGCRGSYSLQIFFSPVFLHL